MDFLTVLAEFFPDLPPITIEARTGTDAYGRPVYAAPVTVPGVIDQTRKLVRSPQGEEVVSSSRVFLAPGVSVPDGSRVTYPDGQKTTSISAAIRRDHGQGELPEHTEITCE